MSIKISRLVSVNMSSSSVYFEFSFPLRGLLLPCSQPKAFNFHACPTVLDPRFSYVVIRFSVGFGGEGGGDALPSRPSRIAHDGASFLDRCGETYFLATNADPLAASCALTCCRLRRV